MCIRDRVYNADEHWHLKASGKLQDISPVKNAYNNAVSYTHLDVYKRQV